MDDFLFVIQISIILIITFLILFFLLIFIPGITYKGYTNTSNIDHSRLWIHRAGWDINKFKEIQQNYDGFEIDLMYDTEMNEFIVSHGSVFSNEYDKYDGEIYLFSDFYENVYNKQGKIWIDYKNCTLDNYKASCDRLNDIVKDNRNKVFIEVFSNQIIINDYFKRNGYGIIYNLSSFESFLNIFYNKHKMIKRYDFFSIDFQNYLLWHPIIDKFLYDVKIAMPFAVTTPFINFIENKNNIEIIIVNDWINE